VAEPTLAAETFGAALAAAGLISSTEQFRRVLIDAQAGHPLRIYVEYAGGERWLDVAPLAEGAEVITGPDRPASVSYYDLPYD
jgi:hypothetical protein